MRLTRYTDYALRTLIYLGLNESRVSSIAEIARAYGISESHLTKVVHQLGRIGLVQTTRGRGGGLRLARPPAEIVVGAVVRQTEEDLALVECFANGALRDHPVLPPPEGAGRGPRRLPRGAGPVHAGRSSRGGRRARSRLPPRPASAGRDCATDDRSDRAGPS